MPVTAKFSRDFYDRFGHEAVDELVDFLNRIDAGYRAELQALNDRNFARFDDRLERRLVELQAHVEARIDRVARDLHQLEVKVDQLEVKVDQLEAKVDQLGGKVDQLAFKVDQLEAKVDQLGGKADRLDGKVEHVDGKVDQLDVKIDHVEARLDARIQQTATRADLAAAESRMVRWMFLFVATAVFTILGLG